MNKRSSRREKKSVWDSPRPALVEPTSRHMRVILADITIADTRQAIRVRVKTHSPVYYIPPSDVRGELLFESTHKTFCEFKGIAHYWDIRVGNREALSAA